MRAGPKNVWMRRERGRFPRKGIPRRLFLACAGASLATAGATTAPSKDWPQLRGPERDGVYRGGDIAPSLPPDGPAVVWERPVGAGFANPVVSNGKVVVFHRQGSKEVIEAWDAANAAKTWAFEYPTTYKDDFGFDEGPRASPVVVGGQVYSFGAEGTLNCLRFDTGAKIWSLDTHREFGVSKGFFGAACTPLVVGSRLFLNVGGSNGAGMVALDKDTGRLLWKASDDAAGYSSPVSATLGGETRVVAFTREGLLVLTPDTGEIKHQMRWRSRSNATVNAAMPIVVDDLIFLSASYGTGAILIRVKAETLETVWSGEEPLSNHYSTGVYSGGFVYGYHGRQEYGQEFRCIDLRSGKIQWNEGGFGAGTVTLAGDRLLLMREKGNLMLAEASPKGFQRVSEATLLPGTARAYPAVAAGRFYARNENKLVCVDLSKG